MSRMNAQPYRTPLVGAAVALTITAALVVWDSSRQEAVSPAAPILRLHAAEADRSILVDWNRDDPAFGRAKSGKLIARDGDVVNDFDIQKDAGGFTYQRLSDDVLLTLKIGESETHLRTVVARAPVPPQEPGRTSSRARRP